jgi:type IV secretion system protein VirD4
MSDPVRSSAATVDTPPAGGIKDLFSSWAAGGVVLGVGVWAITTIVVGFFIVMVILGLLILTGAMKWVLLFLLVAAPIGYWVHHNQPEPTPALPPVLRGRSAGIYGNACYATLDETAARGLIPEKGDFSEAVFLGEYLNWFVPFDQPNERTGSYLGYSGENNILTVAPAGSGKFTTTIAQTLLLNSESTFIVDVKGESYAVTSQHRAERLGHTVVAINPFNMFGDMLGLPDKLTASFNPLANLNPADDNFTTQIDALAAAMIVQEGNDPHWPIRARDLVSCITAHVCSDPAELAAGNNNLPRVRAILGLPREEFCAYMTAARESTVSRVRNLAGGFTDPNSKEVGSIISTAIGQLSFLDQPMIADFLSRSTFDFSELRTKPMTIYFMLPPNELNTYYRFARLIVQACFNALSVEPKPNDRRVLLLLDEQAQLKYMETVASAIALLRGYRVRIWSVFQDLNQLESIYKERWESFVANAGIVQVFTTNDEKTARYFSDKVGTMTGQAVSHTSGTSTGHSSGSGGNSSASAGSSSGASINQAAVPFLPVHAFYSLPDYKSIIFVRGSSDTIPAFKAPYWQQSFLDGAHLPNPYHDLDGFKHAFLQRRAQAEAQAEGRAFSPVGT